MIYDDQHLFVALPQCASSFVSVHLVEQLGWEKMDPRPLPSWNHRPWCSVPQMIRLDLEPFAVIRDPWSFYQSLHRYPLRWAHWAGSPEVGFDIWLDELLDGYQHPHYKPWQKIEVDIFGLMAKWDIGLLTLNYVIQCAADCREFLRGKEAPQDVQLAVRRFLRQDNLREELAGYLQLDGIPDWPRLNVNRQPRPGYTNELAELVLHKERLIIERFPDLAEFCP